MAQRRGDAEVKRKKGTEAQTADCPVFVLRADRPGHLRALMCALQELPSEMADGLRALREFELWMEAHR